METIDILEMKSVTFSYFTAGGEVKILEDASCSFNKGKMYVIMGVSGSGKTTTLSLLEALEQPQKGEIRYKGETLESIGRDIYRRQHIGIVFQSYNLFPYLNVRENVEVSMEITGNVEKKRERAESLLKEVGLKEDQYERNIMKLSGGEQQRVAVARALASEAEVILADEPTGNLDEETATEIRDLFCDVAHKKGKCVIVVTHAQEFSRKADVIVTLKNRKLIIA